MGQIPRTWTATLKGLIFPARGTILTDNRMLSKKEFIVGVSTFFFCSFTFNLVDSLYFKCGSFTQCVFGLSFFFLILFIYLYLFLAVLSLRFCARAFSSCGEREPLFTTVCGPLTIAASLVAEHKLQTRWLSNCDSWAQLLRGMWDLPRPGLEPRVACVGR